MFRFRLPRLPIPRGCSNHITGWVACSAGNSTESDGLTPHPFDCGLFYYCGVGAPVCRRCPAGLHFSPALRVCDWPERAGCSARPPRPPLPPLPPRPHNTTSTEPSYTTEANTNATVGWNTTTVVSETDTTSTSANNSSSNGTVY